MSGTAILVMALALLSCGGAPVKEMDEAKSALEKAKQADAKVYAASEFKDAEDDFLTAVSFTNQNKNSEAKDKAVSSKDKAEKSYALAVENRAKVTHEKNKELFVLSESLYASKISPEEYAAVKSELAAIDALIAGGSYDDAYAKSVDLDKRLNALNSSCQKEIADSKKALDNVQSRYQWAEKNDIVKKYAAADLEKAKPLIAEADTLFKSGDVKLSAQKSAEADKVIADALEKANAEYKKSLEKPKVDPQPDPDPKKDELLDKKKAEDELKKANELMEKLKKDKEKKGSLLDGGLHEFAAVYAPMIAFGQGMPQIEASSLIPETNKSQVLTPDEKENLIPKEVPEEEVTVELVEKYYLLAEEAYADGEYLDAIDFAREAMRLAEILMNKQEGKTYTVVLNPADRDCLWKIAARMYDGSAWMWPIIWKANAGQIKDPDLIYPDQVFKIPPSLVK